MSNHAGVDIGGAPVALAPIPTYQRLPALDVLRAIALFFIFLVNIEYFVRPLEAHSLGLETGLEGVNYALAWCEYVFIERKAWCLFALLFGMGFAVMCDRAKKSTRGFVAPYIRRTIALLVLGAGHVAFLWAGDVLHTYALAAAALLVLLMGRSWWLLIPVPLFVIALITLGGRGYLGGVIGFVLLTIAAVWIKRGGVDRLWKAGVGLYLSPALVITLMTLPGTLSTPSPELIQVRVERIGEMTRAVDHAEEVNGMGSYVDNIKLRVLDVAGSLPDETRSLVASVGLFLIGAWFVRAGVVGDLARHQAMLARGAIAGLPTGAVLAISSAFMSTGPDARYAELWTLSAQLMTTAALFTSVGAVCAVFWLHATGLNLQALAPIGRMALTNYLTQSLICTLTFYGYGLGLADRVDRVGQLLTVMSIFGIQLAFSSWWLRRYQFGPMEWLWRSATYLRFPPMRRSKAERKTVIAKDVANHGWR